MIAIAQPTKTKPQTLEQLQTLLQQEIEESKTELLQLKKSKQYNQQIVNKIAAHDETIQQNTYVLDEIKSCDQLEIGKWVKRPSQKDKKPGQIIDIKIHYRKPAIEIQWWQDSATKLESPKNLKLIQTKDLEYHWDGSKYPKFVRNIDNFECDDLELIQSQLTELEEYRKRGNQLGQPKDALENYDQQIAYLKKRVALIKQKDIENAEPHEIEQLTLISPNNNHSTEQLQILKRFAQRKTEPSALLISKITRDTRTQQREQLDLKVVEEYREAFISGIQLPPVKVKFDGTHYWLYDGFHTIRAAELAGRKEILAEITPGNLRDAILESVGVNAAHGLRRSRETKRRAVTTLLKDPVWGKWSDREIARQCKVSNTLVSNIRKQLTKNLTVNVDSDNHKNYTDKHGNISTMNTANIGKTDPENAETDKLTNSSTNPPEPQPTLNNHQPQEKTKPTTTVAEFETNQLVELQFTSFDGVSENLKLLNHHYGVITSKVEVGNGYNVKFFDQKHKPTASYVIQIDDLKPVQHASLTLTFEPKEYIALMNIYGDRTQLRDVIKQLLTGVNQNEQQIL